MRVNEPIKTAAGWMAKALPLRLWKRYYGLSSFLSDMIALRKTLCLCATCEKQMPRRWIERYDYQFVRGFHIEAVACDKCRKHFPTNMFIAVEGNYAAQIREEKAAFERIRAVERTNMQRTRQYLIGA